MPEELPGYNRLQHVHAPATLNFPSAPQSPRRSRPRIITGDILRSLLSAVTERGASLCPPRAHIAEIPDNVAEK
jgi:hypothetical protein